VSIKIMTIVWDRTDLNQSQTLVALALADHADDEGVCWPSIDRIAKYARLQRRATQRIVRQLEDLELLGVERATGRGQTSRYQFRLGQKGAPKTPLSEIKGAPKTPFIDPSVSRDDTKGCRETTQKGVTATTPESPITTIEPSGLDRVAWQRWVDYRKALRKPIKPVSIPAAQRKLAGFGADQGAVVEQSIANGWQGLFGPKEGNGTRTASGESRIDRSRKRLVDWANA
jgi:hypothetical protein